MSYPDWQISHDKIFSWKLTVHMREFVAGPIISTDAGRLMQEIEFLKKRFTAGRTEQKE